MEIVAWFLAGFSLVIAVFMTWRLWKWEQYLKDARIAVAYKQKVKLVAPLYEWLKWANMLDKDQQSRGRVVYRMGGSSVAILKPRKDHGKQKTRTIKEPQEPKTGSFAVSGVTGNK